MLVDAKVEKAYQLAMETRRRAHAPYSHFQVGAALGIGKDIFSGCNVENASFGATICAERNALWASIAKLGKRPIDFLVVVTDTTETTVPCALCLQSLSEFVPMDLPIYLANLQGIKEKILFKDLLPRPFVSFS